MSDSQLRSLGVVRTQGSDRLPMKLEIRDTDDLPALVTGATSQHSWTLDAFIWKLTLLTAQGRVPEGTDLNKPIFLRYWPNLTRLDDIPHAPRVIALWLRQPHSLLQLKSALKVPFEHILDLYSATSAIGLAGVAKRRVDELFEPNRPTAHKHRGLFSSIIQKLNGVAGGMFSKKMRDTG